MLWVFLILARSCFLASKDGFLKLSLNREQNRIIAVAAILSVIPALLLFPWILYLGTWKSIHNDVFLYAILGNVAFNIAGQISFVFAVSKFDISYVSALKSTSPVIFGFFSFIALGEVIPLSTALFMLVVVLGCILLEFSRKQKISLKAFVKNSGWILILFNICMGAGATVFSKIAVTNGDPEAYIAYRYALLALSLFFLHWLCSHKIINDFYRKEEAKWHLHFDWRLIVAGVFLCLSVIAEMRALQLVEISRVEALTKLTLIFTILFESLFIHKRFNWKIWTSTLLILIGSLGIVYT